MSRQRRPNLSLPMPETLQVLDMGLDFRSYLSRVDENNTHILGNVISYPAAKVADTFEPTVGLLVTILHLFTQSTSSSTALTWLNAYDTIQKVYLEQQDASPDGRRCSQEARKLISNYLLSGGSTNNRMLCDRLLSLLDLQSGIQGPQMPSQRKIPKEPKGAFCNLHLADHRCFQEFSCNQLHLHEAGPVRHRMLFFQRLTEVLIQEHCSRQEILHRVKDSIFFARYGNKVTVRCFGAWVPFFKTIYTVGRLDQAFRLRDDECSSMTCNDQHCWGVHPQDRRSPLPATKQLELANAQLTSAELNDEAESIVSAVELSMKTSDVATTTPPQAVLSPMTEQWRSTIREYVQQSGTTQVAADESLLNILKDARTTGTPVSERMTPLLEGGFGHYELNSSMSSLNSEPFNL